MWIQIAGCLGIGLVWGWLVGSLEGRMDRPIHTVFAVSLASIAVGVTIFSLQNWRGVACFIAAALFALFVHIWWRRELRQYISTQEEEK
jgi:hypothetical protein